MTPPLPSPDRGRRFSDTAADVVFAGFMALPETAKHEFERAVREHLAMPEDRSGPQAVRDARAIAAIREATDLLRAENPDAQLSVDAYRRLRVEHSERGWPPDTSVRRWLGAGTGSMSWIRACERAGVKPPELALPVRARLGEAITAEEIVAALRDCSEDGGGGAPSISSYLAWARRPDVRSRPGRRPMSQGPFDRLFGGYRAALVAANLLTGITGAPVGTMDAGGAGADAGDAGLPRGYRYTKDELLAAIREVSERVGGRSPRTSEYMNERFKILADSARSGEPRALPSYAVHLREHGSWDAALKAAGLKPLGGRATRTHPRPLKADPRRWTDEEILEWLRRAVEARGKRASLTQYTEWREEQIAQDPETEIPSSDTVCRRLGGGWRNIRRRALGEDDGTKP
jgi:hypothetical protein